MKINKKQVKAQVSIEGIAVLALLLIFFMLLLGTIIFNNAITNKYEKTYNDFHLCKKVSLAIDQAYLNKVGSFFNLSKNATISNNSISIGNYSCKVVGKINSVNLNKGTILIYYDQEKDLVRAINI